jgi:hypothetical protein
MSRHCVAMVWLLIALMALVPTICFGQETDSRLAGTYTGKFDQKFQDTSVLPVPACEKWLTHQDWQLTLQFNNATGQRTGRMIVTTDWQAVFLSGLVNPEVGPECYQAVTGDESSTDAEQTMTYDVVWEVTSYGSQKVQLDMNAVNCEGSKCGSLGHLHRQADIYETGDLMYERPGFSAIRLSR